jgi:ATP-dependent Clp protease ATP-binding subunit ClpC
MFDHFDEAARQCIVLTQEEARRLGHPEIGAEHILLGIARIDEGLVGTEIERLRAAVVGQRGVGDVPPGALLQFTPEAKAALEGANEQALSRGHTTINPAHLLLAVLDAEGDARRVLREADLIVADVRERADAAAGKPSATPAAAATGHAGHADHAEELRDGHPVTVRLGQHALPIGDLGHPRVDARLLGLMLVGDTPVARLLRAHGIDEAAIDAALGSG